MLMVQGADAVEKAEGNTRQRDMASAVRPCVVERAEDGDAEIGAGLGQAISLGAIEAGRDEGQVG